MKKLAIIFSLFITGTGIFAQVAFRDISYPQALEEAGKTGKLIFLQLDPGNCRQCADVADKGLGNTELGEFMNQSFICIRITLDHPDREQVLKQFSRHNGSMGSLFIAADGSLIHYYNKTTTRSKEYEEEANKALAKAGEGMRLKELQQQYREGNRNFGFLELYMKTLKSLQQPTDLLLDEYVSLLPDDSLSSFRTFLFVMSMTPVYESPAFNKLDAFIAALRTQTATRNIRLLPPAKTPIIHKSIRLAVERKDETFANRVAEYARAMYDAEPLNLKGEKEKAVQLLYFHDQMYYNYRLPHNKDRYIEIAADYYDRYFMPLSADSLRRQDTINMNNLRKKQTPVIEKRGDSVRKTTTISYSSIAQSYASELSGAARRFLERTNENALLEKATIWAAKAVELYTGYPHMNTYALLLSKTGRKEEAIQWQEKAIALKKKQGMDTKSLEKEWEEMK